MPKKGQLSGYFIKCEYCGKEVYKTKSQYKKAEHHFCSTKCQKRMLHEQTYEDRECIICGKLFHVPIISTQKLCSVECQKIWQTTQVGELNKRYHRTYLPCDYCGEKVPVMDCELKLFKHHFCGDICRQKWYSASYSQSEEWKEESRIRAAKILTDGKIDTNTTPQKIINHILDDMNVKYVNEGNYKYYAVDNDLTDYGLIIEVMGDFWHCNPNKYSKEKMYERQKKTISRDRAKHTYIKNYHNIEILYLWETDIMNNKELCKKLIKLYIDSNGYLENYHSLNYDLDNGTVFLKHKEDQIIPYQEQDIFNA